VLDLSLNYYKAIVQYKGTSFYGWQKQPDQKSIQGELEKVLKKLSSSDDVHVIGSGRTDAGVHSIGQTIRIAMPKSMEVQRLQRALNGLLPEQIKVTQIEESSDQFQPVFDAKSKTYKYYFSTEKHQLPHMAELLTYLDFEIDLEKANEACQVFIGEKDFVNFHTVGTPVKTTVRKVTECRVEKVCPENHSLFPENTYVLIISGNGFLKQMVRLIMSSIWAVARGRVEIEQLQNAFDSKLDQKIAPTAPPQGLYLFKVEY